ncbi:chaperonin 10-like protein [Mycena galopus ATCC 62051]|nr:chaperonin 10-like protein [Mycena galopus ATCC 62051]
MPTQQALTIPAPKAAFLIAPRPIPVPGAGEVRVKILSAGLNPFNVAQQQVGRYIGEYPAVVGADLAGVVDVLGEGVEEFAVGDEVFAQTLLGAFQQYLTLPAAMLIRKPAQITFDEAASFPITFTTAAVGLFAPAPIGLGLNPSYSWDKPQQGQSALVIGAGASTGQFAIQLLKFLGFTRIVAYASAAHFPYLTTLGATEFIDRASIPLSSLAVTPPVNVVYDTAAALDAAYDSVVDGGKVTTARPVATTTRDFATRGVTLVRCFGVYAGPELMKMVGDPAGHPGTAAHTAFGKLMIRELPRMIEEGVVVANRVELLPNGLSGIPDGLARMDAGTVSGVKLVAHPHDSAA